MMSRNSSGVFVAAPGSSRCSASSLGAQDAKLHHDTPRQSVRAGNVSTMPLKTDSYPHGRSPGSLFLHAAQADAVEPKPTPRQLSRNVEAPEAIAGPPPARRPRSVTPLAVRGPAQTGPAQISPRLNASSRSNHVVGSSISSSAEAAADAAASV